MAGAEGGRAEEGDWGREGEREAYSIVDEDRAVIFPSELLSPSVQTLGTLVEQLLREVREKGERQRQRQRQRQRGIETCPGSRFTECKMPSWPSISMGQGSLSSSYWWAMWTIEEMT